MIKFQYTVNISWNTSLFSGCGKRKIEKECYVGQLCLVGSVNEKNIGTKIKKEKIENRKKLED